MHGAVSTNQIWDITYKDFLKHGDVILLSLIGHAPSTVSWSAAKDMYGLLKIQNNCINKIIKKHYSNEKKKVILIGHSTGGTFSIMCNIFFPKKYYATIALTPIIKLEVGIYSLLNIPLNILSKTDEELLWKYNFDVLQYIIKNYHHVFNFFIPLFGTYKKNLQGQEKEYIENFSAKILEQNHMALKYYSLFFNDIMYNKKNSLYKMYKDFLNGKIRTEKPVLILGGKDDILVEVSQQREAAKIINAKYVEIENCGHFCTLDSSPKIYQEIKDFLNI